ncbi:MAG: hypothetical protein QXE06_06945 [Candidatus Bathyarchaeia archaeon]
MKIIDFVKIINGFFCGLTSAGLVALINGILRNNIYLKQCGLILTAVGSPIIVVTTIICIYLKKVKEEDE